MFVTKTLLAFDVCGLKGDGNYECDSKKLAVNGNKTADRSCLVVDAAGFHRRILRGWASFGLDRKILRSVAQYNLAVVRNVDTG